MSPDWLNVLSFYEVLFLIDLLPILWSFPLCGEATIVGVFRIVWIEIGFIWLIIRYCCCKSILAWFSIDFLVSVKFILVDMNLEDVFSCLRLFDELMTVEWFMFNFGSIDYIYCVKLLYFNYNSAIGLKSWSFYKYFGLWISWYLVVVANLLLLILSDFLNFGDNLAVG